MAEVKEVVEYTIPASPEEILSWKGLKVTKAVLKLLKEEQRDYEYRAGAGETLGLNIEQSTARLVGFCDGLKFAQDLMSAKFLSEVEEDDE